MGFWSHFVVLVQDSRRCTMITMSEFQYMPLEDPALDLRLIDIHPGERDYPLTCTIRTFKSGPSLEYQALSYAWGSSTNKVPIIVNGKAFMVTPNLEAALRNLRSRKLEEMNSQLRLWADAICIDQAHPKERNEQVQRMRSIYQRANRVVI